MTENEPEPPAGESTPGKMHPRAARIRLAVAEDRLMFLRLARRATAQLGDDTSLLDQQIVAVQEVVAALRGWADARIEPRRRLPRPARHDVITPRPEYIMFLDECGSHVLDLAKDPFPVFCLCGVIVRSDRYPEFERSWNHWKTAVFGRADVRIHEPDIRTRARPFRFGSREVADAVIASLNALLATLEFDCIAAVIDKRRFAEVYPTGDIDDFLPKSSYLVCIDFIMERFVHFLCHRGGGAQGVVRAESRGLREDAQVSSEYIRLDLEGTQFHPDSVFRGYLHPAIQFESKGTNSSGLQVADLMARPIAEKVIALATTPERWAIVAPRLYDGGQGRRSSYGLKIFPGTDEDLFGEFPS